MTVRGGNPRRLVCWLACLAIAFYALAYVGDRDTGREVVQGPTGYRTGAICRDGWRSSARGSGACSWHGGVNRWTYSSYTTRYVKTRPTFLAKAARIAWWLGHVTAAEVVLLLYAIYAVGSTPPGRS